jgi:hypothetical protein
MLKLANCTMHDQTQYIEQFISFGFDIDPKPLLGEVSGAEEAIKMAKRIIYNVKGGNLTDGVPALVDGILIGGRTDVCVYLAIYAAAFGIKAYITETKRIRDNDKFVFNLCGVTPLLLTSFTDGYYGPGVTIDINNPWSVV